MLTKNELIRRFRGIIDLIHLLLLGDSLPYKGSNIFCILIRLFRELS